MSFGKKGNRLLASSKLRCGKLSKIRSVKAPKRKLQKHTDKETVDVQVKNNDTEITGEDVIEDKIENQSTQYAKRKKDEIENWNATSEEFVNAYLNSYEYIHGMICFFCNGKCDSSYITCDQCGPNIVYCLSCSEKQHMHMPMHSPNFKMIFLC